MKQILSPTLLFIFSQLLSQGNSLELFEKNLRKYPIEKGVIQYIITGNANGKATLYFDRYGWRSVVVTEMTLKQFGVESKEQSKEYWDGDYWYKVDQLSNKGFQKKDDRWSQLIRYKESSEVPGILYSTDGGTNAGPEIVLERETTKWMFSKGIVQSVNDWNGIPLKTIKKLPGLMYEITVMAIDQPGSVQESMFAIDDSINWE